mgnify:CR=1 FL=1
MRIFLAIALLTALALVATSPKRYGLRRMRPVVVLAAGGYAAIAVGAALGPAGLDFIAREAVTASQPLLVLCLGWVGLTLGLQVRREVLSKLPIGVWVATGADVLTSAAVGFGVGVLGLAFWIGGAGVEGLDGIRSTLEAWGSGGSGGAGVSGGRGGLGGLTLGAGLLACAMMGWAMETRSLRPSDDQATRRLELLVRSCGALAGVVAAGAFGVLAALWTRDEGGAVLLDAPGAGVRLAATAATAVGVALVGKLGLALAGKSQGDRLVVFLGVVAFVAGVSVQVGTPPILAGLLLGVTLANVPGPDLRAFERFILKTEHMVAVFLGLLTGLVLSPAVGVGMLSLAAWLTVARFVVKPLLFRVLTRKLVAGRAGGGALPDRSAVWIAPVRQAPVALALAVSLAVLDPSEFHGRLVTVVVLTGLFSDLTPAVASAVRRRLHTGPAVGEAAREMERGADG